MRRLGLRRNAGHYLAAQAALADARRPGDRDQDRGRIEARALERAEHLRELGVTTDEGRAARAAPPVHRLADDRRAVVAGAEFVATAAELAGRGIGEHHAGLGVARERGGAIDDLAHGQDVTRVVRPVEACTAAGHAHARASPCQTAAELEPHRGFVADRAPRAQVRDNRVLPERYCVSAALA